MSGWGHALAAAVGGWKQGTQYVEDAQDRKEEREYRKEQRDNARKDRAEADSLKTDLKESGRTVAVEEGAGGMLKPPSMDNRDVGLPENADLPNGGLQAGGFGVKGQNFTDRASADAAAAKANAPEAIAARQAGVYRAHGAPDKAVAIESADRQAQMQRMEMADKQWRRDLGGAMRGGHDGLAALASSSEAGPMAGLQVKAMVSPDGKSVTYGAADKEGNFKPIPGIPQFSNDEQGLTRAAYMLDRTIDPAARMAHLDTMEQRAQAQRNTDRQFEQQASQFNQSFALQSRSADRQDRVADQQIQKGAIELADLQRSAKIPPGVKMQVEGLRKEQDLINAAIVKAQADGSWAPDSPGGKQLMERQAIVNAQMARQLAPYTKAEGGALADPLGLRKNGGAGRGSAPISYKDPVWDKVESEASKTAGVPTEVLKTIRTVGERSNGDQVSPKGAKGVYQFMPASRDLFLKKYGVDAYSDDPAEQALAAAYHLKESYDRTGSWEKAMAGFNGGPTAEKGTNKTAENKAYAQRTSAALAQSDPMEALYKSQVDQMNKGLRVELSPDVSAWRSEKSAGARKESEQRFNAAQADYLQREKLKAQKASRELVASTGR